MSSDILNAVWVLAALGAVSAVLLIIASKYMRVPVDEKFPKIREKLPGANCGACGYAGCDGYAAALASGEEKAINRCVPGSDAVAKELSELLGVAYVEVVDQVAVVRCRGDCNSTSARADYQGIESCAAAKLAFGGTGACIFGCMGFGDCVKVCPEHAIVLRDGLARINSAACVGCGMCVKTCPNSVIMLMADVNKVVVTCRNRDKGALTHKECSKGCIACRKCERECPASAITVKDNLAVIDYEKCTGCGHCAQVCPVGAILCRDFTGAHKGQK